MKKNWGKLLVLILATAAISGTIPAQPAVAFAAEIQEDAAEDTAKENEAGEEAGISEEIEETEADENSDMEAPEEEDTDIEDTKPDKENKNETITYKEKTLTITKTGFVADTFNGVDAIYRKGGNDGSSATYSCAAFIKKYYKKVYNVSVYNLFGGSTPKTYEGKKFSSVKSPREGDVAYKSGHWSIVKKVNSNGTVTLIEQNWKWGGNQCKANRTVKTSSLKYFRLVK